MSNRNRHTISLALVLTSTLMLGLTPRSALAVSGPVKQIVTSHIGWEVDETTKADVCTVESGDKCQPGKFSSQPDGFEFPHGIAGAPAPRNSVYVPDSLNHRVQELSATGAFVSMFGWDVNRTKVDEGASQAEKNVCTAISGDTCQAGSEGANPGQFGELKSVSVDQASGDVYVSEFVVGEENKERTVGLRVQKFTAEGRFVLEIGEEVNETTKGNLCTQEEAEKGVKCTGPALHLLGSPKSSIEPFLSGGELVVATGGPEDLVYVGDEHRVQEFESDGQYKGEITLTSLSSVPGSYVSALAVDKTGDIFLVYRNAAAGSNIIHEFAAGGGQIKEFPLFAKNATEGEMAVENIAFDPAGRFAVETGGPGPYGALYTVVASGLHLMTEFVDTASNGFGTGPIAFNGAGDMYAVSEAEVIAYAPVPVGELVGSPVGCAPGLERETDVTLDCGLSGEVDAWGVKETQVWFEWGRTSGLGEKTVPPSDVANVKSEGEEEPFVKVTAPITGLRPDETFYYQLSGLDRYVKAPELLTGETLSFTTPVVAPRIVGELSASHVRFSSADLLGELNPENTSTSYLFQYGACENLDDCSGRVETAASDSTSYGAIATTVEITGLQPDTTYHYRLLASNEHEVAGKPVGGHTNSAESAFTTGPAPIPHVTTGGASAVGSTSATISGSLNPDGKAATYAFELGVYRGAGTQYGIVFSGPAGESTTPIEKSFELSGLQPGTTYAYRVVISSGYGTVTGETMTFTTAGLPAALASPVSLAMLTIPSIAFPKSSTARKIKKTKTKKKQKRKKAKRHSSKRATAKHRHA